ncbi:ORC-CDC6 family AAA ATPase [Flavobacterium anhuiense]|uniref:ORC-CDC6 family AAA ATPase n=1 Tax=Flavobacterium anhuiense TaxID=459526 RepID=UPI000E6C37AE|nr:hypothetical protein [Flavobacterium anhuiense]
MNVDEFHISYNARHLNPEEVAKNFIFSKSFSSLIQGNHSVLLGARGCGKTTLMKMLTLNGLHSWKGAQALVVRNSIPFYSVYISTDIFWNVKNNKSYEHLEDYENFAEIISRFSVATNVFVSLCETFQQILSLELNLEPDSKSEIELCELLIKEWMLDNTIPTLNYIKESLKRRSDQFNRFIQKIIFNYRNSDNKLVLDEYLFIEFKSSINLVVSIFDRIFKTEKKWAFCFDELELAPNWLFEELFLSLRSTNQNLIFKLSASPIVSLSKEIPATVGNDLNLIKMWEEGDEKFSKKIVASILRKRFGKIIDPDNFFTSNSIYNKDKGSYEQGSEFYQIIKELISKDESFKKFLISKKVNVEKPIAVDEKTKDTLFRKIKPIVYFRNYYIDSVFSDENSQIKSKLRSRKTATVYSGAEVIYKICDGNPRWLIGIVNSILTKSFNKSKSASIKDIQVDVLQETAVQFMNIISNIPINPIKLRNTAITYTLEDIIKLIGDSFTNEILGPTFKMDPKGSFKVDESVFLIPDQFIELLEKAVYQGALILVDSNQSVFDFEVRGKKFRLAYMLAPLFKLPLRTYGQVNLSTFFTDKSTDTSQKNLFE